MKKTNIAAAGCLSLLLSQSINAAVLFSDDFSDNSGGWTLGSTWEIGSATASTGGTGASYLNQDPGFDNTATADNGVAGVVIGGQAPTNQHGFYYLTSAAIDASSITGQLTYDFYRWLNSDYTPFMQNVVDVFDGTSWVNLWASGPSPGVSDSSWNLQSFDITAYANSALQVRMGYNIANGGVWSVSSWNVDDVSIYDEAINVPEPSTLAMLGLGVAALGFSRKKKKA